MDKQKRTASDRLELRLYVAGDAPNSMEAMANLRTICGRCLEREE